MEQLRRNKPGNLTAYDCELRGRWAISHWNEGPSVAVEWFEKAIAADPGYAMAHAGLAMACSYGLFVLGLPPDTALARAKEHAHRAVALDDRNATVSAYAAFTFHLAGEHRLRGPMPSGLCRRIPTTPSCCSFKRRRFAMQLATSRQALQWFERSERIQPYSPDDMRVDTWRTATTCWATTGRW